jgi:hypothetical protein
VAIETDDLVPFFIAPSQDNAQYADVGLLEMLIMYRCSPVGVDSVNSAIAGETIVMFSKALL